MSGLVVVPFWLALAALGLAGFSFVAAYEGLCLLGRKVA